MIVLESIVAGSLFVVLLICSASMAHIAMSVFRGASDVGDFLTSVLSGFASIGIMVWSFAFLWRFIAEGMF